MLIYFKSRLQIIQSFGSFLQNETVHEVSIQNPSIYRIILRYINPNPLSISGTISVTPETGSSLDAEQKFQVIFFLMVEQLI